MPDNKTIMTTESKAELHIGTLEGEALKVKKEAWQDRINNPFFQDLDQHFHKTEEPSAIWDIKVSTERYQNIKDAVTVVLCSDERLSELQIRQLFEIIDPIYIIRIPGTRVGLSDEEMKKMGEGIKGEGALKVCVTSHQDCGAARLDAGPGGDADAHAQAIVEDAALFGMENLGYIDENIAPSLQKPHPGCSLVIDMTGKWVPEVSDELPVNHFVLSGKYYQELQKQDLMVTHAGVLAGIPMGHHGIGVADGQDFGFSKEHPFYIFVADTDKEKLGTHLGNLQPVIDKFAGLIKVVGFILPLEEN